MQTPNSQSEYQSEQPITLVVSEVVEPDLIKDYEEWTKGFNFAAQQFAGFVGVEVIRPRDHQYPEYVVIIKFDNYIHYKAWIDSEIYAQWMQKSVQFIAKRSLQYQRSGLELWFSLPRGSISTPQPAYYKQVVIGVIAVYPLILLSNWMLAPFLQGVPTFLSIFISVIIVSALLTYPVMPYLTHILEFWLYPRPAKTTRKKRSRRS